MGEGLRRPGREGARRFPLKLLLLATIAWAGVPGGGFAPSARAQDAYAQRISLSLPPQDLGGALASLADKAGMRLLFQSSIVAGRTSPQLSGRFTIEEALSRLLAGSGLTYSFTSGNAIRIIDPRSADAGTADDGSLLLDTIDVTAGRNLASGSGFQGTPDWVYQVPSSLSVVSREAILNAPARNARDLLDTVAGVYANRSNGQDPGIAINIRGLQDQSRIVTMIDGARQNFQLAGHGTTQRTYVDTAFVREIDVEKMGTSGVGGSGALGGLVDFRTIVADDLIKPGSNWGAEVNATTGTNEFKFDGSASAAWRVSDSFSILGGAGYKEIGAYEIGKNGDLTTNSDYVSDSSPVFSGSEVFSSIVKAEAQLTDDISLSLGWLRNDSSFSTGYYLIAGELGNGERTAESVSKVTNDTYTANLHWDPASDLIDLRAKLWYNNLTFDQQYVTYTISSLNDPIPVNYKLGTLGGSIENTSRFDTAWGDLSLNYGVEAFRDDGSTEVSVVINNSATGLDGAAAFTGPNPTGTRDVVSGFSSATLKPTDWLSLTGGLRYDWYRLQGTGRFVGVETTLTTTCQLYYADGSCRYSSSSVSWNYPEYLEDINASGGKFLPSFTVSVQPFDWLQPFARYAQTYRPPTLMEQLWGGQHSYTSTPVAYGPNPSLVPEEATTYEIGVNLSRNGVFAPDDKLRMKVVGFYREVDNYITYGTIWRNESGRYYTSFVNLDGPSKFHGVEIEGNYDAGLFYVGTSVTVLNSTFADSYTYYGGHANLETGTIGGSIDNGDTVTTNALFVPPSLRFTVDAGVRLFDQKLTLGGRLTRSSGGESGELTPYEVDSYTVYDIYGSYAFDEDTKLRFAVNNVTDLAYVPSLGSENLPAAGRTATVSLNKKF